VAVPPGPGWLPCCPGSHSADALQPMHARVSLADLRVSARFLWTLPSYLRRPVTRDAAVAILRQRLERRESDFLALVDRAVYANPSSPYRRLLALAGCEPGDLAWLVKTEGIEGALRVLCRSGVYLTVDEFKGRRVVRRGSATLHVNPIDLRNPLSALHVPTQTGGSGGAPGPLIYDLATIHDRAVNTLLALEAQGGGAWPKGVWGVSTGSAPVVLRFASFGPPVARWFVHVSPRAPGLHPRYRWVPGALRLAASLGGVAFPRPEQVPTADPLAIARWMVETLRAGHTPHLYAFVSPVVRLCQAAREAGIELRGARFTVTGEPVTAARLAVVQAVGAEAVLDYGSADAGGPVSHGCLRATAPDDVHFSHDLHALIQPGPESTEPALPPGALLLSSLRATSPLVLLNVSMGDQARVATRHCGCPLDAFGWSTHLDTIRSFEKLTAGGMTFLDVDVVRVLEEDLPARFGGGPADYQVIEEETGDGRPKVALLVHPRVGPLDETTVREAFLDAVGRGSGAERIMALHWREVRLPVIERRPPIPSGKGKIHHVWRSGQVKPGLAASGGHAALPDPRGTR
jgi:hypothetical protein